MNGMFSKDFLKPDKEKIILFVLIALLGLILNTYAVQFALAQPDIAPLHETILTWLKASAFLVLAII